HQDGLVHISSLADHFVDDPHKVVKAGDIVKVKVMEVDLQRKRIALTMRLDEQPGETAVRRNSGTRDNAAFSGRPGAGKARTRPASTSSAGNSAMSDALC
ncbi:RNA-binding transcriptional accessory protein, partial [Escherichia coli]|uniref:S1 RNA-binding domain-containing protein n=1 Tax=Escherichia coli TaxID=562 RepID=UPI000D4E6063